MLTHGQEQKLQKQRENLDTWMTEYESKKNA